MLKIVIAIFVILGLSLISSLIAAAAPGWIIGNWLGHEVSGSLLWVQVGNTKVSYSSVDELLKVDKLGKHLFPFCSSRYSYLHRLHNITYDFKLQIVKLLMILQHKTWNT